MTRECPCYLHHGRPMPLNMASPCICECEVPHRTDVVVSPASECCGRSADHCRTGWAIVNAACCPNCVHNIFPPAKGADDE